MAPFPNVRIKLLGVFDTVGALGVPVGLFTNWNQKKYAFHDVALGSNIDHALHALAIDEKRGPFAPSLWQYPNHKNFESVEQVWFPGVHANVGGGYPSTGLSDVALEWMLSRIEAKGLGLKLVDNWRVSLRKDPFGTLYESRSAAYFVSNTSPMVRVINQCRLRLAGPARTSALPPHAMPLGEMLHVSALDRWKAGANGYVEPYRPINVEAALNAMFDPDNPRPIPIVGENGASLDWFRKMDDRKTLLASLPDQFVDPFKRTLDRMEASGVDLDVSQSYQQPRGVVRM